MLSSFTNSIDSPCEFLLSKSTTFIHVVEKITLPLAKTCNNKVHSKALDAPSSLNNYDKVDYSTKELVKKQL